MANSYRSKVSQATSNINQASKQREYKSKTAAFIETCFNGPLAEGYSEGLKMIQSLNEPEVFVWVEKTNNFLCSSRNKQNCVYTFQKTIPQWKQCTFDPLNQKLSIASYYPKYILEDEISEL